MCLLSCADVTIGLKETILYVTENEETVRVCVTLSCQIARVLPFQLLVTTVTATGTTNSMCMCIPAPIELCVCVCVHGVHVCVCMILFVCELNASNSLIHTILTRRARFSW